MAGFSRKPAFEAYSPGRRDARLNEAQAMLSTRRTLDGLTAHGLSCSFNLRPETAAKLLEIEGLKRGG